MSKTNFNENTNNLLSLLKEYYAGDVESMQTLIALEKTPQVLRQYEALRENPVFVKIRDEILPKLTHAYSKLTSPTSYDMTDMERAMHLCTIAWGEWFLQAFGDKPEARLDSVENHIKKLAERAGVVSKE